LIPERLKNEWRIDIAPSFLVTREKIRVSAQKVAPLGESGIRQTLL